MSDLVERLKDLHLKHMAEICSNSFDEPNEYQETEESLAFYEAITRIEALEAALKPFANEMEKRAFKTNPHWPDSQSFIGFKFTLGDLRQAASLLEKKPAPPTVEHITGVALKEPKRGTTWVCEKPKRHHDVFAMMQQEEDANPFCDSPHDCQQGFHTSTGRFVTRLEAMQIAKAAGQLIRPERGGYQGPELFSEDLW